MDSILSSSPLQFPHRPTFTSIRPIPTRTLISSSRQTPRNRFPLSSITFTPPITFATKFTPPSPNNSNDDVLLKHLVRVLFCFAVGFGAFRAPPPPALAIALPWSLFSKRGVEEKERAKSHEYSHCTDRLLETVSFLLRIVEDVRKGNAEASEVEAALKAVKLKREELYNEIMGRLNPELKKLRGERKELWKRSGEILREILKAMAEYDKLKAKKVLNEKEKKRVKELEVSVEGMEDEYNGVWERVGEIEDLTSREETVALSYGVREINFIESECEQLVERFKQELRQKEFKRSHELIT